jgi:hypothetical protein
MYHYTVIAQNGASSLRTMVVVNTLSKKLKKTHTLHTIGSSELECSALFGLSNKSFSITAPWKNFNGHEKTTLLEEEQLKELEKTYDSAYNELSNSDKRILSAMIANILGDDWKSSFIIIENKNNSVIKKAVEIATQEGIEVFDLSNKEHFERIQSKIIKTEKQYEKEKTTFLTSIGQKPYKNIVCKLIK